jgi:uncharacterized protein (TIGR00369 family)
VHASHAPLDPRDTFDALLGLEITESSSELVRARVPVRDAVKQMFGLVHGGVYAAAAESVASLGSALVAVPEGNVVMGMSNNTSFMRSITQGTLHVEARPRHRGRTTWIWDVEMTDDENRLCAVSRVTIAVRPQR